MIDPLVIVHPRKVKGAETMQGARKRLTFFKPMRLSEAMEKKWPFFAHFTLYTLQGESAWPRLNKPVLPELIEAGLIPQIHVTALDYDTPGHSASLSPADFQNMLAEWPTDLPSPTYAYRTRHGARFVIVHPALLPHEAEAFHRACVNAAPYLDPRVWEWNRGHALPYVCREPGVPAIDDPMLVKANPARQLPTLKDPGEARFVHAYADAPMPDPIDAEALVRDPTTHKLTSWGKRAKKRLATRDSEDALTWPPPPTPKRRNPTLLRWIGSLCSMLHGKEDTTPEHVFGVVAPIAKAWQKPHERDLTHEAWRIVSYCWAQEEGEATQAQAKAVEQVDGLRAAFPDGPSDPQEFYDWLRGRVVLTHGQNHYVLQSSGRYSTVPVKTSSLVAAVRVSGLVGQGKAIQSLPASPQAVLDMFSLPVNRVVVRGGPPPGGRLEGSTLRLSYFALRDDLVPTINPTIDEFMHAFFGTHYPRVEEWVAGALDLEGGPIAALSLEGPRAIGKNLFVTALGECLTSQTVADKSVFGAYQYDLDRTCFVHIDEGIPRTTDFPETFRCMIGGAGVRMNLKYRDRVEVLTPFRVIVTANTPEPIAALFGREDLVQDDREALAQRVVHLRLSHGGRTFLGSNPREITLGWVNDGRPEGHGQHLFARHLLALKARVEARGASRGGRFLVEGDVDDPFLARLQVSGDVNSAIGEALVDLFRRGEVRDLSADKSGASYALPKASEVCQRIEALSLAPRGRGGYNLVLVGRRLRAVWALRGTRTLDVAKLRAFARDVGLDLKGQRRGART